MALPLPPLNEHRRADRDERREDPDDRRELLGPEDEDRTVRRPPPEPLGPEWLGPEYDPPEARAGVSVMSVGAA